MGFKPECSGNSLPEACGAAQPLTPAFWCFWKPPASSPLPAHLQDPAPTTAPRRAALRLMLSARQGHSSLPSSPGISADSFCSAQGTRPEAGSSSSSFPPTHTHTPRASLTSLPRCHRRCRAAGKPASASIRAFTSPTVAAGGSSNVLQPRQPWRTVTRGSLRRHERHRLRRAARSPPSLPPSLPHGGRRRLRGAPRRAEGKEPPRGAAGAAPHARCPPCPVPMPLTCPPRRTKGWWSRHSHRCPSRGRGGIESGRGSPSALRRGGRGRRRRKGGAGGEAALKQPWLRGEVALLAVVRARPLVGCPGRIPVGIRLLCDWFWGLVGPG